MLKQDPTQVGQDPPAWRDPKKARTAALSFRGFQGGNKNDHAGGNKNDHGGNKNDHVGKDRDFK